MNRPPPFVPTTYNYEKALDDIPGLHWSVHEFLHSRMLESEEYTLRMDPNKERLYFATGYGLIQCLKGLMSFEDKDLHTAINDTKRGNAIAAAHRKQSPSLAGRLASYIVPGLHSGPEWIAQMTPLERHAELVYAESLYEKSLLGIVQSGDWLTFIKEVLNMRTTMSIYRQLGRWLESVDAAYTASHSQNSDRAQATTGLSPRGLMEDPSVDCHFRSGVYLGLGMSHLALSLMPARLVTIVEMFGYRADRMEGLRYLEWPGGWSRGRAEDVVSQEDEGVRRPFCDMTLLIFHLVLSMYTFEGVDINMAERIVNWNLKTYPDGPFFLFGAGRLALARSQPERALEYYARGAQCQAQYRSMNHISWWESAIANMTLWNVRASIEWWSKLAAESTWSKATFTYAQAACLAELGEHAAAAKLMENVSGLRQRIAGKSIPLEKFAARKARKYIAQKNRALLPALEFGYFFSTIARAPPKIIIEKMVPDVRRALEELGLSEAGSDTALPTQNGSAAGYDRERKASTNGKGVRNGTANAAREGYWDDVCLVRFLEGVCWQYLTYPNPDAELDESERNPVPIEDARRRAEGAFQAVFEHGPKIELDHYLVYYSHFECGRFLASSGMKDEARKQFDKVISGKTLEANPAGRKGKYSLENALLIRTHSAVDALSQDKQL
ncbi:hypothetical protein SCLCIDRAFT_1211163 [Scleroderma citrinum Foug A]|uniref:Uncharacterized protein n=1 Tax=Scleroderma citrinum Foug A TaxID=1036808 RepID=A0A0C2ZY91_9AGAM|nr:hypothetical protein SCLCIDRAFT_1211163 [Scleroderma citrinum Foug A]